LNGECGLSKEQQKKLLEKEFEEKQDQLLVQQFEEMDTA
jgi:hypothetical protein